MNRSHPYTLADLQDGTMQKILDQLDEMSRTPQVKAKEEEVLREMRKRGLRANKTKAKMPTDEDLIDAFGL